MPTIPSRKQTWFKEIQPSIQTLHPENACLSHWLGFQRQQFKQLWVRWRLTRLVRRLQGTPTSSFNSFHLYFSYLEDNSGLSCEDIQKEEELLELCNMVSWEVRGGPKNKIFFQVNYGTQMLTVAVMAILITAPMGAILIMLTGPRLLAQDVPDDAKEAKEEHKFSGTYEMQELGDADGFSDSPNRVARFKAAQHHGSQQLIAARRFSCL